MLLIDYFGLWCYYACWMPTPDDSELMIFCRVSITLYWSWLQMIKCRLSLMVIVVTCRWFYIDVGNLAFILQQGSFVHLFGELAWSHCLLHGVAWSHLMLPLWHLHLLVDHIAGFVAFEDCSTLYCCTLPTGDANCWLAGSLALMQLIQGSWWCLKGQVVIDTDGIAGLQPAGNHCHSAARLRL